MTAILRSTATADRCIQVLQRIVANHSDDHVCLVEAGALRIALREMQDHTHCEEEIDETRGKVALEKDEEAAAFAEDVRLAITAMREKLTALEGLL